VKYWGLLFAKFLAIGLFVFAVRIILIHVLPVPLHTRLYGHNPFLTDLTWAFSFMLLFLVTVGLTWVAIHDQKHRCRTCARRLRMPVLDGSWDKAVIFERPHLSWICPYGHGTMTQAQLQITGREAAAWSEHGDFWKELEAVGRE
jgi:hypothetical protein